MLWNREIKFIVVFCAVMLKCMLGISRSREAVPLPFLSALLSKEVTTLYQDRNGFIWVGTTYGVARYDGYETILFTAGNDGLNRLTNNEVTDITDIPDAVLVGTERGLNIIDSKAWKIVRPDEALLRDSDIKCLFTARNGDVWIAIPGMVLCCDEHLHIKKRYVWPNSHHCGVTSIYQDRQGRIWLMTWGAGLYSIESGRDVLVGYPPVGRENRPYVLFQDDRQRYWLGTWGDGLFRFYPNRTHGEIYEPQPVGGEICFDIMQDRHNGNLWMLFYQSIGIFKVDSQNRLSRERLPLNLDPNRMFSKMIQDCDGRIWLGAYDEGYQVVEHANNLDADSLSFIKQYLGFDANLNCMAEDEGGVLWLNQERYSLVFYNPANGQHSLSVENPQVEVNYIAMDTACSAWVASMYVERVFRVRRENMRMVFTDTLELNKGKEPLGYVRGVHLDREGYLWVQTGKRLFVKLPCSEEVMAVKGMKDEQITGWAEDDEGNIWLGGSTGRLYKAVHCRGGIRIVVVYSFTTNLFKKEVLNHLVVDKHGKVWMTTTFGQVFCFEPQHRKLIERTKEITAGCRPILDWQIYGDTLCALTPSALVCHDLSHGITRIYEARERQIPITAFRNTAICRGKNGWLYAGGHGGYIVIRSDSRDRKRLSEVEFTDIVVNGESLWQDGSTPHVDDEGVLCLSSDSRQMIFSFSTLDYDRQRNIRYEYRLDEDEGWNLLGKGEHTAVFNYLSVGRHVLHVRAMDSNGECIADGSLLFKRLPRWYETFWARGGFVLVSILIVVLCGYGFVRSVRRKNERKLQQEIAQTKLDYFTNVSHELLTPLTVLSCLADEIEQKMPKETRFIDALRSNARRLRKLIRQVLDFRKVENNAWPLRVAYADVMAFINRMADIDFTMLARGKQLTLVRNISPESAFGYYDADKLEEILFNLLSNAVKYTNALGRVGINAYINQEVDGIKQLCVEIWDEGIGIAEQEQQKIFTRFYHSGTGSAESNGIGLSLTQKLVALHHGTLTLKSRQGEGSCFMVQLPLDRKCYAEDELRMPDAGNVEAACSNQSEALANQATLLVIDDNVEILEAMKFLLGEHYRVLVASEVSVARKLLSAERVDLVVCDVRLPDVDGLTFCKMMKSDVQTSHIPILMLTAQNDEQTRADCYEAGADGFMAKPFETKVLTARIENLLLQYKKRQKLFRENSTVDLSLLSKREKDGDFLAQLVNTIEGHLQDSDFDLDLLAVASGLSKSTLNRKIKTMTGLTPMDFVRNIRLKYACALLAQGHQNVSEVAYSVGFSDPQYFAKCFKEAFKETPSQFQRKNRIDKNMSK